jgi:2-hydroxycyclohexanecarboxyl-CoA dehydrogenase
MSNAVVVTGAGRAIGKAIAETLAADGWVVIGIDLEFPGDHPHLVRRIAQDIADTAGLRAVLADVVQGYRVTGLVNCAAIVTVGRFLEETQDYWRKVTEVNFIAPLVACQALLPAMIENGGGAIVNITSDSARAGVPNESVYSGTKGGLAAFSRSLAHEVGRFKITVNNVSPGLIDTPMSAPNPDVVAKLSKRIPMKRIGVPRDVAKAVAFLLSPEADYITGQTLSVGGGLTMAS